MADLAAAAQAAADRRYRASRWALVGPALIVIGIFGIAPLLITFVYSCLGAGTYGGVEWRFTPEAYVQFLFDRDIFSGVLAFIPDYLEIFWRSILLAFFTTVICLLVGFPTAYF